jgi:hypothetical protein
MNRIVIQVEGFGKRSRIGQLRLNNGRPMDVLSTMLQIGATFQPLETGIGDTL